MILTDVLDVLVGVLVFVEILLASFAKTDEKETKHLAWAILLMVVLVADVRLF